MMIDVHRVFIVFTKHVKTLLISHRPLSLLR